MCYGVYQFTNLSIWQLQNVFPNLAMAQRERSQIIRILIALGEDKEDAQTQVAVKVFAENLIPVELETLD